MYRKFRVEDIVDGYEPKLSISQLSELAGLHPQTVRQYDKLGLISATRTKGGSRRFCLNDVQKLIKIQLMSSEEGINLNGIRRILTLEEEARILKRQLQVTQENMIFAVNNKGETKLQTFNTPDSITNTPKLLEKDSDNQLLENYITVEPEIEE